MFATTPTANVTQAMPMFSTAASPPATLLGLLPPAAGKASHGSNTSTRATSPSSSTASSEGVAAGQRKPPLNGGGGSDVGALARRRGRSVLMLSELVIDIDSEGKPGGSPSTDSSTSLAAACGNSTRCTPCTPQLTSFSPLRSTDSGNLTAASMAQRSMVSETVVDAVPKVLAACPPMNQVQVAEHGMMRTSPMQKSADASQRSPACAPRLGGAAAGGDASQRNPVCASRLGGAAAGGDASQRTPVGTVGTMSLGTAVIGGDASQRSPPGCPSHGRPPAMPSHPNPNSGISQGITGTGPTASPNHGIPHGITGITGTCPTTSSPGSSRGSSVHDASQRNPAGAGITGMMVENCNDALKSWLSGGCTNGSPESGIDLAERLRAAAPDSYED